MTFLKHGWIQEHYAAVCEPPDLVLSFYRYGVMLKKRVAGGIQEYPVDPSQVASTLAASLRFDTGLLSSDTLLIQQQGQHELIASYRKAQTVGVWLDDSQDPLRVPLPPLVLIRQTIGQRVQHQVYAVKRRPKSLSVPLFHAPLPNVYSSGQICWGNIRLPLQPDPALSGDWQVLLGTPFGNHAVAHKSRAFPHDIRQHLLHLDQQQTRRYPTRDLVDTSLTLEKVLQKAQPHD
jgi:PRTRC genetic system protein B